MTNKEIQKTDSGWEPGIILPERRRKQLELKLDEYKARLVERESASNPEEQLKPDSKLIYKIFVLDRLLQDGSVKLNSLSLELKKELGNSFNKNLFTRACIVIQDYCETGGENIYGGTGLPQINLIK